MAIFRTLTLLCFLAAVTGVKAQVNKVTLSGQVSSAAGGQALPVGRRCRSSILFLKLKKTAHL